MGEVCLFICISYYCYQSSTNAGLSTCFVCARFFFYRLLQQLLQAQQLYNSQKLVRLFMSSVMTSLQARERDDLGDSWEAVWEE